MNEFEGKVAIVTGAGSGIGEALCLALAERGAKIVLSDINSDRVDFTVNAVKSKNVEVEGLVVDVRNAAEVKAMIDFAVKTFGKIDYLFNNAGICVGGPTHKNTPQDWKDVIDVNLYGVVNGVTAAYPVMVGQGEGHIINTGSIEGLCPFPATVSYAASKYGVVGLSHSLRVEGAAYGVKVSVVCPGFVKTRIFEDSKTIDFDRSQILANFPSDWLGVSAEECAKIILNGVRKNKDTIVVTPLAKLFWYVNRIHPPVMQSIMRLGHKFAQKHMQLEN